MRNDIRYMPRSEPTSARVTRLETSLDGVKESVGNLTVASSTSINSIRMEMEKLANDVRKDIGSLAAEIANLTRTNWPLLIGAAGLAITIGGGIFTATIAVGSFAYSSLSTRFDRELAMRSDVFQRRMETVERQLDRLTGDGRDEHDRPRD